MTRLFYKVGNEEINSYSQAVARSKELGIEMETCYEPISESIEVNDEEREKRCSAIYQRAHARAN